jgi:protein-tyrosine phosphatase
VIKKILFVCTGNICRSPTAEYYLRKRLKEMNITGVEVESVGILALDNNPVSQDTRNIMESLGIFIDGHRSSPLTLEKVQNADLILVMEKSHKKLIEDRIPRQAHKVKLLGAYINGDEEEIIDPYGNEETVHRESFEQIRKSIENLIREMVEK